MMRYNGKAGVMQVYIESQGLATHRFGRRANTHVDILGLMLDNSIISACQGGQGLKYSRIQLEPLAFEVYQGPGVLIKGTGYIEHGRYI